MSVSLGANGGSYSFPETGELSWGSNATNFVSAVSAALTKLGLGATLTTDAVIDIVSTTKGVIFPRMTTTQRNAISTPVTGMLIFNTSTNRFNFYYSSAWGEVGANDADVPVGAEVFFDDANSSTPAYSTNWVEANGQTISDAASPYNGKRIRNLNGATLTGIAITSLDNTAKTITVSTNDIQAFISGDTLSFTGAAVSNAVVKSVNYSTGVITVGDSTTWASGNYSNTTGTLTGATAVDTVGLKRYAKGNAANTGGGGVNRFQGHKTQLSGVASRYGDSGDGASYIRWTGTNTGVQAYEGDPITNGVNGTPRQGDDTEPNNFEGVWLKRIK